MPPIPEHRLITGPGSCGRSKVPELWLPGLMLLLFFIGLSLGPLHAQKTDVVIMKNGDRLTCEFKKMELGKLRVSTDDMGTLYIEWDKIRDVISAAPFLIEMHSGVMYFGSLDTSHTEGHIRIIQDATPLDLQSLLIVTITPYKQKIQNRFSGRFSLGYQFTQASQVSQLNSDGLLKYNALKSTSQFQFSTVITDQPGKDQSRRITSSLSHHILLKKKNFVDLSLTAEQNTELGLDLRLATGAGIGKNLVYKSKFRLPTMVGLKINREFAKGNGEDSYNLEAFAGFRISLYRYDFPKLEFTLEAAAFPNISNWGRIRVNSESRLKWEVFRDFFLELKVWQNYDSQPPSTEAANFDWAILTSLGWSFGFFK